MEEILNVWAENIQRQVKECSAESYEKDIKSLGNCLRAEKAQWRKVYQCDIASSRAGNLRKRKTDDASNRKVCRIIWKKYWKFRQLSELKRHSGETWESVQNYIEEIPEVWDAPKLLIKFSLCASRPIDWRCNQIESVQNYRGTRRKTQHI